MVEIQKHIKEEAEEDGAGAIQHEEDKAKENPEQPSGG